MSDLSDIEDGIDAAERIRKILQSKLDDVEPKLAPDMVQVTGWCFGLIIDGEQYVVGVEKV